MTDPRDDEEEPDVRNDPVDDDGSTIEETEE